ncbi:hypothetical protein MBANPS3_004282 [Mucor bainieri]
MTEENTNHIALILGATGAVGKQLLKDVLKRGAYTKVVAVGRRLVDFDDSVNQEKLVQEIVDFDNLESHRDVYRNVSDVFCCLATSRTEAGSAEKFIKIDQTYVLDSAKLIHEENKPINSELAPVHFLYCSSTGADKDSMFLYPKTKGQTEEGLSKLGFEKVSIFRPGALKVVEPRPRPRIVEAIIIPVWRPFDSLFRLKSIHSVDTVGKAMHQVARDNSIKPSKAANVKIPSIGSLISIYTHSDIEDIGNSKH